MIKQIGKVGILVGLVLHSVTLYAQTNISCNGVPEEVFLWGNSNGYVAVDVEGHDGPWILCSLSNESAGISMASCNAIYSAALSALMAEKTLRVRFNSSGYASCEDVPNWDTDTPNHFNMLRIVK